MNEQINALRSLHGDVWAMEPARLWRYVLGWKQTEMSADECEAKCSPRKVEYFSLSGEPLSLTGRDQVRQTIGVIPLVGPITHRASSFTAFWGGTSVQKWKREFDEMVANPRVSAVVIDVDSPGGSVAGVSELADTIRRARRAKPIVAAADTWAASAAYHLASQATSLYVTPSGEVGSIGVYSLHMDASEMLMQAGLKPTIVQRPELKTEGNPYQPLTDEARDEMQRTVDHYYAGFVDHVARGRNAQITAVKSDYGRGRMVKPARALEVGMVDGIATYEQVVSRLAGDIVEEGRTKSHITRMRAEIDILTN